MIESDIVYKPLPDQRPAIMLDDLIKHYFASKNSGIAPVKHIGHLVGQMRLAFLEMIKDRNRRVDCMQLSAKYFEMRLAFFEMTKDRNRRVDCMQLSAKYFEPISHYGEKSILDIDPRSAQISYMFPVQPVIDAIAEYKRTKPDRDKAWDDATTNDLVMDCEKLENEASNKVKQAFYEMTRDRNSRAHCQLISVESIERLVRLQAGNSGLSDHITGNMNGRRRVTVRVERAIQEVANVEFEVCSDLDDDQIRELAIVEARGGADWDSNGSDQYTCEAEVLDAPSPPSM